ncbi:adenosylcobinamide amidohydrolase [Candidatus Contubernalis alkaliaceticus]|uniref:adenosylcobinamide amidohydrolase n=1 Tax=Candidatus Contubernalis alkaliaceticus TaxID=338645 RepID=UPI001F4BD17B|nr:adenosylcobinamide amidohydrolase [Candidatus Contubernalis alkalaceticus]
MIFKTDLGDEIHRYQKSLVVLFKGKRKVLSTSPINGGYNEDLKAVFNNDCNPGAGIACELKAPTYEEHMELIAEELGLNSNSAAGIGTAASMDNVSIQVENHEGLSVTAVVTGGVEVNGGRVGDPASYDERKELAEVKKARGTINIILEINVDLTPAALTRALVTCTEAKTAALQELMAPSRYSTGLATGSGTDGTILICNGDSPYLLTNTGKHSKLGELIGRSVKSAVKEALHKQSGLNPKDQRSVLKRFDRYGLTEESLWRRYCHLAGSQPLQKPDFIHNLHVLEREAKLVAYASLYIHLLDQYDWQLLNQWEIEETAAVILENVQKLLNVKAPEEITISGDDHLIGRLTGYFEEVMVRAAGKLEEKPPHNIPGGDGDV